MNRLRLAASAVAATSLSSLGLAGVGASAAHAAPVTPGAGYNGRGFDTCTAPSDAQMDDWYAHSPYHAVGVYIGGPAYVGLGCAQSSDPSFPNHGGYTNAWVQHQAAAGWAMWALYSGSQAKGLAGVGVDPVAVGATEGADAIASAQALGFPQGTIIFADMEGYSQAAYTPNVVAYLKSFAATLSAGGYKAGLYGNSTATGTTSTLGDAAADPAVRDALAAVDIAAWASVPTTRNAQTTFHSTTNDANLDPALWSRHQRIHQYFGGHNETYGSTTLNIDSDQVDLAPAAAPDLLDGRIARLTGTASEFGGELDSLADVISFGVAPAVLLFRWGFEATIPGPGWVVAFLFVTCGTLRLARFNVQRHVVDSRYFVGLPIPAGAGQLAAIIYSAPQVIVEGSVAWIILVASVCVGLLMVSTIRYRSFKSVDLRSRRGYPVVLLLAAGMALVFAHSRTVLPMVATFYVVSGPIMQAAGLFRRRGDPPPTAVVTHEAH